VVGTWPLRPEWLRALEESVQRFFPANVTVQLCNDSSAEYVMLIEKGPPVRLKFNLAARWAASELFQRGYLDAAVKHESRHIHGEITFLHAGIVAPLTLKETVAEALWRRASEILTEKLQLLLNETYALAITEDADSSKYLDYELWKFTRAWNEEDKRGTVKAHWILYAALLASTCQNLNKSVPDGLAVVLASFKRDMYDEAILSQAVKLFNGLWNAVRSVMPIKEDGKHQFDVLADTIELNEVISIQKKPLFNNVS
jgi:hypothetical protein